MAESMEKQDHRKKRIADIHKMLQESFPEVEHVAPTRFLVWGSAKFKYRPYLEIWFDHVFLDQERNDLLAYTRRIVSEAETMLNNPDRGYRKQGEILASGVNGITVRRGVHIYRLDGTKNRRKQSGRID